MENQLQRLCSKEAEILLIAEKVGHISDRVRDYGDLYKDVHTLVVEIRAIKEDVIECRADLSRIKAKPAETLKWVRTIIGGVILTAIIGLVLRTIGLL